MNTTMDITLTLSQEVPEKEPLDQLCKFTMLSSLAKVTTKSVIAEHIYPIITPDIISTEGFFTFLAISNTKPIDAMDPIKAETIIMVEFKLPLLLMTKTMVKATVNLAPDEIPRIYGPAMGLLKKVCKRKPERAKAPPSTRQAIVLGNLIFQIISSCS